MDPLDYLTQLGGVARTAQLLAAGYSRTEISRLGTMRLLGLPLELLKAQLTADRSGRALKALHELDLRAESIVEVDAQHLFRANGIGYDAQVYLPGIGRVDFLIEGFLIVEVDGFAFHSSRESLRRDLGRNNAST